MDNVEVNILMDLDAAGVDLAQSSEISALVDVFPQAATIRYRRHPLDCTHCCVRTSSPANVLGYEDEAYLEILFWKVEVSRGNEAHGIQKIEKIEEDDVNDDIAK